ncbi:unnamed protein product [Meloidogyne enterolobii]|uniref:Uncharacterized protein n=1 Tax=Meloidogyne enterolobii TaxID=390850 RepID=A0ACB0ZQD0_MELEN
MRVLYVDFYECLLCFVLGLLIQFLLSHFVNYLLGAPFLYFSPSFSLQDV